MPTFSQRISNLDVGLFSAVDSETSDDDRQSLLLLQRIARIQDNYAYLEIGSHLGGTLQTHLQDPRCSKIYSIDLRPEVLPDIRLDRIEYRGNSTQRMLDGLRAAYPEADMDRILTFDLDAADINASEMSTRADLCFIDGEHTNDAVISDFSACRRLASANAIIAFHDSCLVFKGLRKIKHQLTKDGTAYRGVMLRGCVYVLLIGQSVRHIAVLAPYSQDEGAYFRASAYSLWKKRMSINHQYLYIIYRKIKAFVSRRQL